MRNRGILYILLALGIVLIGSGVWLMLGSTQAKIVIPQGNPVIYEQVRCLMRGENYELFIYDDGSILYIEEKGLRIPSPEHPASGNFSKSVTASGYLTPDNGETYPDMPAPLNEIYGRLRTLKMTTGEVYQENISP